MMLETSSGALLANDCLVQYTISDLPFGGVGKYSCLCAIWQFWVVFLSLFLNRKPNPIGFAFFEKTQQVTVGLVATMASTRSISWVTCAAASLKIWTWNGSTWSATHLTRPRNYVGPKCSSPSRWTWNAGDSWRRLLCSLRWQLLWCRYASPSFPTPWFLPLSVPKENKNTCMCCQVKLIYLTFKTT